MGCVYRYVTVLDVASIKPDAESLEASVDWDPSAPFHHSRMFQFELRQQVADLSKVLARRGPQVFINTPSSVDGMQAMTSESPGSGRGQGQSRGSGPGPGRGRGRGKGKNVDDESPSGNARGKTLAQTPGHKGRRRTTKTDEKVKHGESSKRTAKGTASSEHAGRSDSKRKGDEEFEAQIAMALAATAAATTPTSEKEENSVKGLRKGGSSGSVWSSKMGPLLHWAEVYCGGEGSNGR